MVDGNCEVFKVLLKYYIKTWENTYFFFNLFFVISNCHYICHMLFKFLRSFPMLLSDTKLCGKFYLGFLFSLILITIGWMVMIFLQNSLDWITNELFLYTSTTIDFKDIHNRPTFIKNSSKITQIFLFSYIMRLPSGVI